MATTMQALWQSFFQEHQHQQQHQQQQQQQPLPEQNLLPAAKRARTVEPESLAPLAPKPIISTMPVNANIVFMQQQQQQQVAAVTATTTLPYSALSPPSSSAFPPPNTKLVRTEHRKRKNAEYARVTRERKRNQELLLNLELASLERENERLKALVRCHLPHDQAQAVIGKCCYTSQGRASQQLFPHNSHANNAEETASTKLIRSDFELIESLTKTRQSFVLTDPRLPDNPIVYASRPFLALTGYSRAQVLGRNCRFLQGIDTDPNAVAEIRQAIAAGKDGAACLLNYKADGTPFWNQFFVAPLRDKQNQVVNYVGVQHPIDKPEPVPRKTSVNDPEDEEEEDNTQQQQQEETPIFTPPVTTSNPKILERGDSNLIMKDDEDMEMVDWAELAKALEGDYHDFDSLTDDFAVNNDNTTNQEESNSATLGTAATATEEELDSSSKSRTDTTTTGAETTEVALTYLEQFFTSPPREFVARTIRSELIDCLLTNGGDVTDKRFLQGFNVLSELFRSSINFNTSLSTVLNGSWRSISRPMYHYGGCVGMNDRGDFVYTLGKMCFNMFKPGNVRVTVQHTMNHIEPVCRMDQLPTAAPWSLRRELCLQDPSTLQASNVLKSYDVVVALTIEPGNFGAAKNETIPSPTRRLKALQVARGFFLPDPDTPGRLTVWFTGGELAPAPLSEEDVKKGYGGLDDWVEFFGAEYKRTWSEALSDMGAKLFLGAELPNEMDPGGKMEYTLHRPFGGHGKGHADVMYVDGDLLITKGHSGSIHVMVAQK